MALDKDYVIFDKKTFADLAKDIYNNVKVKKSQINKVIATLSEHIQTMQQAEDLVPLIRDLMETSVKNDDQLVKLAAIVQRGISSSEGSDGGMLISEEEREQLLAEYGKKDETPAALVSAQVALANAEDAKEETPTEPDTVSEVDSILARYSETDGLIEDSIRTSDDDEDDE